jgi:hypothetical protein
VIAHVVLLAPRPDLSDAERGAAIEALSGAVAKIPDIKRYRIGRRVTHGLPGYEKAMTQHFEVAMLVEFDDLAALRRYLTAPAHIALGHLFSTATSAALAYDFEIVDGAEAATLWQSDAPA